MVPIANRKLFQDAFLKHVAGSSETDLSSENGKYRKKVGTFNLILPRPYF